MRTIYLLKGLPGCGKSTFAAELIKKEPKRWIRINRDDMRGMVVGPGNNPHARDDAREELVRNMKNEAIRSALKSGYDVILDDTHLVPMTVKKLHSLAMGIGDVKVIEKGFNVGPEECIARDAKRTGFAHVGDKVIQSMARMCGLDKGRKLSDKEAYYPPRWIAGGAGADPYKVEQDNSLPRAILCDLDGTLALMNGRNPFDASTCDRDLPNVPVIECVKAMHAQGVKIIFMSGRDAKHREPTIRFIEQHCRVPNPMFTKDPQETEPEHVIPYDLNMRPQGDMRKDSIIKAELFDAHIKGKYSVLFVLDDRNQVVDGWREMGLTCFQVAPGAF